MDIPGSLAELMSLAPAGYAIGLHIRYSTPTYMFQTYPKAWLETYSREGLLVRDPMVAWAFSHEGHVSWDELAQQDEAGVFSRAADHGLRHGIAVSLSHDGSRSMAGFARSDRPFAEDEVSRIESVMLELHRSTASAQALPEDVRASLRRLSVIVTHP